MRRTAAASLRAAASDLRSSHLHVVRATHGSSLLLPIYPCLVRRAPGRQRRFYCTPPPDPEKNGEDKKKKDDSSSSSPSSQPPPSPSSPETPSSEPSGSDQQGPKKEEGNSKPQPNISKGFEKWYPSEDNPTIPVAKDEYRRKVEESEKKKEQKADEKEESRAQDERSLMFARLVGMGLFGYVIYMWWSSKPAGTELDWGGFSKLVIAGEVRKIEVYNQLVAQVYLANEASSSYHLQIGDPVLFEKKLEGLHKERVEALGPDEEPPMPIPVYYRSHEHGLVTLIWQCSLPLLVLYYFVFRAPMLSRTSIQSQLFRDSASKHQFKKEANVKTKFKDVAGMAETKQEIMEVVDFLKNPKKYNRLGAKIPKGILLTGPPGVGKTLIARATAGESGVPFYSVSGSDFMEVFVGVGPARVRELFKEAQKNSPCIVFIDEIDAIGRKRQTSGGRGHDSEQESTLNTILVQMDGFSPTTGVVVLAGTNRHDILDKALLRPGRFDRQIALDKPPLADRKEIFMVHLTPLTLSPETHRKDMASRLATLTPGFSGADIMSCCNEAALISARNNENYVSLASFEAAIEKIVGGLEKKNKKVTDKERKMVAFHEAGHVICSWYLKHVDPILKVSVIPRGSNKLSYTQHLPKDKYLSTQDEIKETMIKLLGGRAAEEIIFKEISTGSADDMHRVTHIALQQVIKYGFSTDTVGHMSFPEEEGGIVIQKPYSKRTEKLIDAEVQRMVEDANKGALDILTKHREQLELVANTLLEKEVLSVEALTELLGQRPQFEEDSAEMKKYFEVAGRVADPEPKKTEEDKAGEGAAEKSPDETKGAAERSPDEAKGAAEKSPDEAKGAAESDGKGAEDGKRETKDTEK